MPTMRWIDRFWREDGRAKATPARLATVLADGVTRSTNMLRIQIQRQASFSDLDHKRFESEACVLECLLFEWFLRDMVVAVEFSRHAAKIQDALARRVAADLDRSGLSPAVLLDLARLRRERFREYRDAAGIRMSLQSLGAVAWQRIADVESPSDRMTMALAIRATAELQALRGLAKKYALVIPFLSPRVEADDN
jgi:hypothetical protein